MISYMQTPLTQILMPCHVVIFDLKPFEVECRSYISQHQNEILKKVVDLYFEKYIIRQVDSYHF